MGLIVPEEIVEETWVEVAQFSDEDAQAVIAELDRCQPELMAYIMTFSRELSPDAAQLVLYLFVNVYLMFRKSVPTVMGKVRVREVIKSHEHNENFIGSLAGIHDKLQERIAEVQIEGQPFVMEYLVEAILEADQDEEDPITLSEQDTGYLFLALKTAVDCLTSATTPRQKKTTTNKKLRKICK